MMSLLSFRLNVRIWPRCVTSSEKCSKWPFKDIDTFVKLLVEGWRKPNIINCDLLGLNSKP